MDCVDQSTEGKAAIKGTSGDPTEVPLRTDFAGKHYPGTTQETASRRGPRGGAPLPSKLLKVRDVAGILQVSTATIYVLCERGELPHVRVGNGIRFEKTGLAAYLSKQRGK